MAVLSWKSLDLPALWQRCKGCLHPPLVDFAAVLTVATACRESCRNGLVSTKPDIFQQYQAQLLSLFIYINKQIYIAIDYLNPDLWNRIEILLGDLWKNTFAIDLKWIQRRPWRPLKDPGVSHSASVSSLPLKCCCCSRRWQVFSSISMGDRKVIQCIPVPTKNPAHHNLADFLLLEQLQL